MNMTDKELGYQHGTLGFEEKYPNNTNYHDGFCSGYKWLLRELYEQKPFEYIENYSVNADYIKEN